MHPMPGLIFDLDGTLLDTIGDIAAAMNVLLKSLGHEGFSVDRYRKFVGDGARAMVARALAAAERETVHVDEILALYLNQYRECCLDSCRPYKGINKSLLVLSSRKAPMGILSNKPDEFTRRIVEHFFPAIPFVRVMGECSGRPRKPDPAGALRIAAEMRLDPDQVFFIGDSPQDMETGKRAGMISVGVLWGFRTRSELLTAGADKLLDDPLNLTELLN